jgi:mono/diheme cytochrome c family protein
MIMAKQRRGWRRVITTTLVALVLLVGGVLMALRGWGVDARSEPSWIETQGALFLRGWMTPARYKTLLNPVAASPEAIAEGRDHFADHCASCHANDGSGNTDMGRALYPRAPDMRLARTQELSDGELFYIIENGVRLTGMPGWSTGTPEGEKASWQLVRFIRHLPTITAEEIAEMERLNPRSPAELQEEKDIDDFLRGSEPPAAPKPPSPHKHPQ